MQCNESWIRTFCNPNLDTKGLADLLTMSGMEVEDLQPVAPAFSGVVVARILKAEQHPNADRLRVCLVDAGKHSSEGPLQIVCGAPNAREGLLAPLAVVGASLPPGDDGKPFVISKGKLRGVESFGMLCAADELGLGSDHAGLLELPDTAIPGTDLREYLNLDDTIFTLKLTPNLGHCLSVYGIAREISALTGSPLVVPSIKSVTPTHDERLPVKIEAPELCGRFTGRVIKNVNTKVATPTWMAERLLRAGQRPVSVLVDISNYVMFELGRPNHIFDLDRIHGGLRVRWAREGESLELLNGKTVDLDGKVGIIADDRSVESLAGIMGGNYGSVQDSTQNIYVEAAFWYPEAVAGRARRFNFSTEAGHRFERGVDPASTVEHVDYITSLILEICGGEPGPMDDQSPALPPRNPVTLRLERAKRVSGLDLEIPTIQGIFDRLGFTWSEKDGVFTVIPPSWRFDITIEADLIEEIVRIVGYDKLPQKPPLARGLIRVLKESRLGSHGLRTKMASLGYHETINYSFVEESWETDLVGNPDPIRLLNPIAAPLSVMRSSLLGSLLGVLQYNINRKATRVQIFELGKVFIKDPTQEPDLSHVRGIRQPLMLGGLLWGPAKDLQWGEPAKPADFFDAKGDIETLIGPGYASFEKAHHPAFHPGRSAQVTLNGKPIGWVGELHPKWTDVFELGSSPILFELLAEALLQRPLPKNNPLPKHQAVVRDLALVLTRDSQAGAVLAAMKASDTKQCITSITPFDLYQPGKAQGGLEAHERSLAVRLEILDPKTVLTDAEIQGVVQKALDAANSMGARLRS